jgi:hypothetical protein
MDSIDHCASYCIAIRHHPVVGGILGDEMSDPIRSSTFCVSDSREFYTKRPAGFRMGVLFRVAIANIAIGCAKYNEMLYV